MTKHRRQIRGRYISDHPVCLCHQAV